MLFAHMTACPPPGRQSIDLCPLANCHNDSRKWNAARACSTTCARGLTSVDATLFGRPEILVTFAAKKFDEKTLELTDQPTIDMVKAQLAAFETFVRRVML